MSRVEYFLLPLPRDRVSPKKIPPSLRPTERLDAILHEVSIAEYIRLLQFLYRDTCDELELGMELRSTKDKITTKQWLQGITEARARIIPLCRLCYGEESLESLRALVDLGSIYAVQGLWPQVSEHMSVASQKLAMLLNNENHEAKFAHKRRRLLSAAYITNIFRVLQDHAIKNRGYITESCVKDIEQALMDATAAAQSSPEVNTRLEERIHEFCNDLRAILSPTKPPVQDNDDDFIYDDEPDIPHSTMSWGRVVDYLRHESSVMQGWIADIESAMLVQNKSILKVAFSMGDRESKGVCHPVELSRNLMKYPAATRICSGTQIIHDLSKLALQVPIAIDKQLKTVVKFDVHDVPASSVQMVTYELPVTWEEFLSFAILNTAEQNQYDAMRLQILNLLGLCNVFSNKLSMAEENMKHALAKLESLNWDMELVAIELYNSISQLMVVKHRQWQSEKKDRCMMEAENWIQSTEGKAALKDEMWRCKKGDTKKSVAHAESKAKTTLIKSRMKTLLANDTDPTKPSLEAAYRYLVRSFEILESSHGANHATVASTSLAIASVQNVMANYEESKEWLMRAVRIMEKLNPPPQRAIAFTQTQLSNILVKLRHPKSAIKVLIAATEFYAQHASHGLLSRSQGGTSVSPHYLIPGEQLTEDVSTSLELMSRLMQLYHETGSKWQAAEQAENMAELAEAAYGWDSVEHADYRKQVLFLAF